ncbi:MAG: hypothetical protein WC742_15405 [Gallionellaceae bacterium]
MKLDKATLNGIKKALYKLPNDMSLQDWLDAASGIHPVMSAALSAFYCGHDGSITEPLDDKHMICMMWHERENGRKVVEAAYIS